MENYIEHYIERLATKLDKVTYEYDPYGYIEAKYSVEMAKENITNNPLSVIEYLLDAMEILMN